MRAELARQGRVRLYALTADDREAFVTAVRRSRALHHAWVRPPDTEAAFDAYLARMTAPVNHPLVVRRGDDLVGVYNVSNIVRGAFQSGYLGYYAFAGFTGLGLMHEGLLATLRYAFRDLKLHRLEANIQPGNADSIALVRRSGFEKEGYSPRYLKIGGRWRDHERWARRAER